MSRGATEGLTFLPAAPRIQAESQRLRSRGVKVQILVIHEGTANGANAIGGQPAVPWDGPIMEIAAVEVDIEPVQTTIPPGGVDRPLNGVLARKRADEIGLTPLRPWREALEDYMSRAKLAAVA